MVEPFWEANLIYKVVAGSRAYGLETPESDWDYRGVCIPPRRYLLGLSQFEQREERAGNGDVVIYALVKFVRLALAGNPSIIELLFVEPQHIVFMNDYGRRLREKRGIFLSRQVRQTFAEYAISQLRRIERHHRWLITPPSHPPTQEEFGGWPAGGRFKFPDHDAHRAYQAALKQWNQYQEWLRKRNPARAELERRYGYDTKHAVHLLRLLKMGIEILEHGEVRVYRPDREWLLAVRSGLLAYEELLATAASYEAHLQKAFEASPLPAEPNVTAAEALVVDLQERFLWQEICRPGQ